MTRRNYFRLLAEDQWHHSRWTWFWKPCLSIASAFYRFGTFLHRACYGIGLFKRHAFDRPVISVGNIVWGGSGKTPLVEYLTHFFLDRGKVPLILARGYGSDESEALARNLPKAQFGFGKNRFAVGQKVMAEHPVDIIILDDGFQHHPIQRDMELVMINALNPFGNMSLIPRGILREPVESLKRASLIVLNDVDLVSSKDLEALKAKLHEIVPGADLIEAFHEPLYFYRPPSGQRVYLDRLRGMRVTSFSGIGTPRSFQLLLNRLGLRTVRNFEFGDHHRFTEQELNEICRMKQISESGEIVTTEKDYYRCEEAIEKIVRPLVLKVRLHLTSGEVLLRERLNRLIQNGMGSIEPVGDVEGKSK